MALFSSVLRDDFRPDSDVLVEFEPGQTAGFKFWEIEDELTELFGRQVELNTPNFLSRYFRKKVQTEASILIRHTPLLRNWSPVSKKLH